jgi:hypothetical protein
MYARGRRTQHNGSETDEGTGREVAVLGMKSPVPYIQCHVGVSEQTEYEYARTKKPRATMMEAVGEPRHEEANAWNKEISEEDVMLLLVGFSEIVHEN